MQKSKLQLVLFDMDGTLTPPRQPMQLSIVRALTRLQNAGFEIGIVTGSDLNYLQDQCNILFDINSFDFEPVHWLPCNGTKYYKSNAAGVLKKKYEMDMINSIGIDQYNKLLVNCFQLQKYIAEFTNCPLTGNFFNYRGSMLNWCPIGRSANSDHRQKWEKIDTGNIVRLKWKSVLEDALKIHGIKNITVKLGGETSFDIYPVGWDKTYCLRNFEGYSKIIFVGDRCFENGNDKDIYDYLKDSKIGSAYSTKSPTETIKIIDNIIREKNV